MNEAPAKPVPPVRHQHPRGFSAGLRHSFGALRQTAPRAPLTNCPNDPNGAIILIPQTAEGNLMNTHAMGNRDKQGKEPKKPKQPKKPKP